MAVAQFFKKLVLFISGRTTMSEERSCGNSVFLISRTSNRIQKTFWSELRTKGLRIYIISSLIMLKNSHLQVYCCRLFAVTLTRVDWLLVRKTSMFSPVKVFPIKTFMHKLAPVYWLIIILFLFTELSRRNSWSSVANVELAALQNIMRDCGQFQRWAFFHKIFPLSLISHKLNSELAVIVILREIFFKNRFIMRKMWKTFLPASRVNWNFRAQTKWFPKCLVMFIS